MRTLLPRLLFLAPAVLLTGCGQGEVSYADDVKPIIDRYCISCHSGAGEGVASSAYLLTSYESTMTGTKYGQVVVPGSRMSSSLYLVIAGKTAPEIRMPPHNDESFAEGRGVMLSADAIETIGLWIDQGAMDN